MVDFEMPVSAEYEAVVTPELVGVDEGKTWRSVSGSSIADGDSACCCVSLRRRKKRERVHPHHAAGDHFPASYPDAYH